MKKIISLAIILITIIMILIISFFALRQKPPPIKASQQTPAYDKYHYGIGDDERIIDFGTQPNAIFTSENLFHDRILQQQLAKEGWRLREHPFRNGKDMLPYADGRLDVMVLGDIPAFVAMNQKRIGIFALCRQGYNSIIASRRITPSELNGLRVGYPPNTTAHFAIDRTLNSANLSIKNIISIPMQPDEMEQALRNNIVDIIISWEPTASTILTIPGTSVLSLSDGYSYIAMDLDFTTRNPNIQKAILAAHFRATKWARLNEQNIKTALIWDRKAGLIFLGKSSIEANEKWISLLRKETIDNPSFPMLPLNFTNEQGIQYQQFQFLKKIGTLPASADWKKICSKVYFTLLPAIIRDAKYWQIDTFDYSSEKLYQTKNGGR
ncbi:MAG: hypothetical protein HQK79_10620 [Desulfobacterales bacterium]|nr:hypothetical protein [Desulfobacterales bacterium]MBF0396368.1 hypothetical protein [Desulfobacterales bacterium]